MSIGLSKETLELAIKAIDVVDGLCAGSFLFNGQYCALGAVLRYVTTGDFERLDSLSDDEKDTMYKLLLAFGLTQPDESNTLVWSAGACQLVLLNDKCSLDDFESPGDRKARVLRVLRRELEYAAMPPAAP